MEIEISDQISARTSLIIFRIITNSQVFTIDHSPSFQNPVINRFIRLYSVFQRIKLLCSFSYFFLIK